MDRIQRFHSALLPNRSHCILKEDKLLTMPFILLTIGHFLQALGYSSMLLLPLYLDHLQANRTEIGMIMAIASVGGLSMRPAVGWALDAWGRKKTLIASTAMLVFGMLLIYFVQDLGPTVYLVRILIGIGVGGLFTGYFTFAADIIPVSRRTEGIALFGISGLVPLLILPFSSGMGIEPADLRWFFPLVAVVIAGSFPALMALSEPEREERQGGFSWRKAIKALSGATLWSVWIATAIFSMMVAIFMTFTTVSAENRGISDPLWFWGMYAFGAVCVRLFGAKLPDRLGPANLVAPALCSYCFALLLVAYGESREFFLLAGLLAGIGHGYCFPVLTSQVVSRIDDEVRGTGLSMFTGLWGLVNLCITPMLGWFSDSFDDRAMFSLTSLIAVVGLALWLFVEHTVSSKRER